MRARLFSYGGSGLKFLTNFLNEYINVYDVHHAPHSKPNKEHLKIDKIVYLYADPRDALLSFCRREQRKKGWINKHNKHLQNDTDIDKDIAISGLTNKGGLGLETHFKKWIKFNHPQIAFVKYEYLDDSIKDLLNFLDLDENISSKFINAFLPRASNYNNCDKNTIALLNKCYKGLIEFQNLLPDFYIK